jgi:hypothetical protein
MNAILKALQSKLFQYLKNHNLNIDFDYCNKMRKLINCNNSFIFIKSQTEIN